MSELRNRIINRVINAEGGYVNDPSDSGGETKYGVTAAVARANGYGGDIALMPRSFAFDVYVRKYWDTVKADWMPEAVAAEVVDTAVNMGTNRAVVFLQRCLNVFNQEGRLYNDIAVDGIMGSATLSALQAYLSMRDEAVLVKALNCLQGAFYIELAESREKDERFTYGWLSNRVSIT